MSVRQMPGAKASGAPQFAGMGIASGGSGGGGGAPATRSTLGSVIVGNGLDVTVDGLLSFSRQFGNEFDTGLRTHDGKTIYGVYVYRSVDVSSGSNSKPLGEAAGISSNVIDIFGYVKDSGNNRNGLMGWLMYDNHVVVIKFNAESSGSAKINLLILYTKN